MFTDPLKQDFRLFGYLVWKHLGLPDPTAAQYEMFSFMQHGYGNSNPVTGRSDIVECFRGIGKSFAAAAYVLWRLYCDPETEKILVVSASSTKAKEFVAQVKGILMTMPLLEHLRPRPDQRDAFDRFDVNGASLSQSPSLKAAGITGQIVGSRATLIVADDVEIVDNSRTEEARANLLRSVSEFDSIKVPAMWDETQTKVLKPAGDILFLGTPQTADSIYTKLIVERQHSAFCIPARYPTPEKRKHYVFKTAEGATQDILAPYLRDSLEKDPSLVGQPTDPQRFTDEDLLGREAKGRAYFALQFMLDTTLSDAEKYPLKQHDLIVMPCNRDKAPMTVAWGRHTDRMNIRDDIPNAGFTGDYFMGPLMQDPEWRPYTGSVLFVDTAGRGKDETAWAIVKMLNGMFYCLKIGAHQGDVNTAYMKIAMDAKAYNVNLVEVEPNYAGVVWISAFQPILNRIWPGEKGQPGGCSVVESEWAKGNKEARIIDTLEPVMNTHRLIVDESVARDQVTMYQMTHITAHAGSLTHEDRVDALAGAVAHFTRALNLDTDRAAAEMRAAELDAELQDFVETCQMGTMRRGRGRRKGTEVFTVL